MCELGRRLKEAREARGLEISQAAEFLKVRGAVLEALEECRFDELPEAPLARGYLRRYAQLLGLDPAPLLALYPTDTPPSASSQTAPPGYVDRAKRLWLWVIPMALLLGLLGWWGYLALNRPATTPVPTPSAPPAPPPRQVSLRIATQPVGARVYLDGFLLGQAPLEARVESGERTLRIEAPGYLTYEQAITLQSDRNLSLALTPAPQPIPPANPAGLSSGLVLRFEGTSWIRVTDARTGRQLYEGTVPGGTQLSYPLPVVVRVGNAGAVRVFVNGQDQGRMGNVGQVVTRRFEQ